MVALLELSRTAQAQQKPLAQGRGHARLKGPFSGKALLLPAPTTALVPTQRPLDCWDFLAFSCWASPVYRDVWLWKREGCLQIMILDPLYPCGFWDLNEWASPGALANALFSCWNVACAQGAGERAAAGRTQEPPERCWQPWGPPAPPTSLPPYGPFCALC